MVLKLGLVAVILLPLMSGALYSKQTEGPAQIEAPAEIGAIALSPNGELLAAGCGDGWIYVFEVLTGKMMQRLKHGQHQCEDLKFSADGKLLLSRSWNGLFIGNKRLDLWRLSDGEQLLPHLRADEPQVPEAIAEVLNRVGEDDVARNAFQLMAAQSPFDWAGEALLSPHGDGVLVYDGFLEGLWWHEVSTGRRRQILKLGEWEELHGTAIRSNGQQIAALVFDSNAAIEQDQDRSRVVVWSLPDFELVREIAVSADRLEPYSQPVFQFAVSNKDLVLVTGDNLLIFDWERNGNVRSIEAPWAVDSEVMAQGFNGRWFTIIHGESIEVWSYPALERHKITPTGVQRVKLKGLFDQSEMEVIRIDAVALDVNGRLLAWASNRIVGWIRLDAVAATPR